MIATAAGTMAPAAFVAAILSAVFNGSFAAFSKLRPVRVSRIDPIVFNLYCCLGVALSSFAATPLLARAGLAIGVSSWGVLAGSLFVLAVLFSFLAIPLAGLSVSQGVWGGTAIFVAFLWGAAGPAPLRAPLASLPLSALAVALLLAGVLGIVNHGAIAARLCSSPAGDHALLSPPAQADPSPTLYDALEVLPDAALAPDGPPQPPAGRGHEESDELEGAHLAWRRRLLGMGCALLTGVFGGSVLVPSAFVPRHLSGFGVLPSFGAGALGASVAVTAAHVARKRWVGESVFWGTTSAVPAGLASGLTWNAGNVCSIYAMNYAGLNYGIAYPILQCALFVSGLLGIFAFREITEGAAIAVFFAASAVLITGAVLLSLYGPNSAS